MPHGFNFDVQRLTNSWCQVYCPRNAGKIEPGPDVGGGAQLPIWYWRLLPEAQRRPCRARKRGGVWSGPAQNVPVFNQDLPTRGPLVRVSAILWLEQRLLSSDNLLFLFLIMMVTRDRIELPARGFSDPCSVFWPPCFQQRTHAGPALGCHKWTGADTRWQESVTITIWSR